jgi:DNA-binding MarR family transcriptional regulator
LSIDAADRFHSAAIHALRHVRREDPATGVPPAQLSALSVLVYGGPRTLGELAAAEQVRPPTMTRIVQGLEAAALVRRARDREDGRVHRLQATPKGRRVMQRGRERRVASLAALLGRLSEDDVARVREAAELVEAALAADSGTPLRRAMRRPGRPSRRGGAG